MIIDDHVEVPAQPSRLLIEPTPPELLRHPLDFLFAEHYRHRQLCRILDHLAEAAAADLPLMARADDFIRYDLALHVIDEEEDLFPLLRRRCEPDDDIDQVIGRLSGDHRDDAALARTVRAHFAEALAKAVPIWKIANGPRDLRQFARQERAHVALENAVVMPLARARLGGEDQRALSRRLAARRGIYLEN
ncbi:MAG: hemerythrin domain-containing protein [Beijerinckiaceae bacterium]|jgi:hemerythrin-like domain-containing protein|nr:hemerythrin domain-containing protein [Beijerinckiaceae bacterium]